MDEKILNILLNPYNPRHPRSKKNNILNRELQIYKRVGAISNNFPHIVQIVPRTAINLMPRMQHLTEYFPMLQKKCEESVKPYPRDASGFAYHADIDDFCNLALVHFVSLICSL
jgi:hypothetical protein